MDETRLMDFNIPTQFNKLQVKVTGVSKKFKLKRGCFESLMKCDIISHHTSLFNNFLTLSKQTNEQACKQRDEDETREVCQNHYIWLPVIFNVT